jgi:type II secretory pathway pseudopilin PulG
MMNKSAGFTLVEVLIGIAAITAASAMVFGGFQRFAAKIPLDEARSTILNDIREAKSTALSQNVNQTICNTQTLNLVGYRVNFFQNATGADHYRLEVVCRNSNGREIATEVKRVNLPDDLELTSNLSSRNMPETPGRYVLFEVLTGESTVSGTITITKGSDTRTINVGNEF